MENSFSHPTQTKLSFITTNQEEDSVLCLKIFASLQTLHIK